MPGIGDYIGFIKSGLFSNRKQLSGIVFIDTEVGVHDHKVHDFGAVKEPNQEYHGTSKQDFARFIENAEYLCGHNIIHHDLKYFESIPNINDKKAIDTLYLSPLLFPKRPYHKLLKDASWLTN